MGIPASAAMNPAPLRAWALVPVRPFADAKSRLAGILAPAERARLAEEMLKDVLRALAAAPEISGIALLGNEPRLATLAEAATARRFPEPAGTDYREALAAAARQLEASGARHLLVLPGDLPTLTAEDVSGVLAAHADTAGHSDKAAPGPRLTLVPAARDGGSNALVLSPPSALPFLFGPDSARRHREAAAERGVEVRQAAIPGFSRDIDLPADVEWLLTRRVACATLVWLKTSGIADRLKQQAS